MSLNLITSTEAERSPTLWVVMNSDMSSVVFDPGTQKPFATLQRERAEEVAREVDGIVMSFREAVKLVTLHPANLPGN